MQKISSAFARLPRFARTFLTSAPIQIFGTLLQFAISIFIARLIGPAAFGAYTYAFVWAVLVGVVLGMGMGRLGLREIPKFIEAGDSGKIAGILIQLVVTLLITACLAAALFWWLEREGILVLATGWALTAALALTHAVTLNLTSVMGGFQLIVSAQLFEGPPRHILLLLTLLAVVWAGIAVTPSLLFALQICAAVPLLLIAIVLVRRAWRKAVPVSGPIQLDPLRWYLAALPMGFTGVTTLLNTYMDILMIGSILGDEATGIYRAASRAAILAAWVHFVILRVMGPMLSKSLAQGDRVSAQRLMADATGLATISALAVTVVLAFGANIYLGLYGQAFTQGAPSLVILLVAQTLAMTFGAAPLLATLTGRQAWVFSINLSGLVVNFVLNWVLIRQFGTVGAAVATGICIIGVVASIRLMLRIQGETLDPSIGSTLRLMAKRLAKWR